MSKKNTTLSESARIYSTNVAESALAEANEIEAKAKEDINRASQEALRKKTIARFIGELRGGTAKKFQALLGPGGDQTDPYRNRFPFPDLVHAIEILDEEVQWDELAEDEWAFIDETLFRKNYTGKEHAHSCEALRRLGLAMIKAQIERQAYPMDDPIRRVNPPSPLTAQEHTNQFIPQKPGANW